MIKLILKEDKASISGNQQFIKKNVIAMLRKVGISKMKADTLQVPEGEISLSFDANPEQKEQLKQLLLKKVGKKGSSKRAKLHFIDTLKELKRMVREEIKKLKEGSVGKFGKDESDVFGGVVRVNKKKNPKDILKIVLKDKFLSKNIKSMGISNKELLNYINGELRFAR